MRRAVVDRLLGVVERHEAVDEARGERIAAADAVVDLERGARNGLLQLALVPADRAPVVDRRGLHGTQRRRHGLEVRIDGDGLLDHLAEVAADVHRDDDDGLVPESTKGKDVTRTASADNIFSLNFAKNTKESCFILCEGYMDVIALNQAGFDNAVATLGTAITASQANLMKRYTSEVVISYDADGAGQKATMKAINLLNEAGLKARGLSIPDAKDPDEYIKTKGADAFRNLIDKSENHIDYQLQRVTDKYDLSVDEQKVAFLKEASDMVAHLPGSVERQVYAMRVASMAGVGSDVVSQEVERRRKRLVRTAQRADAKNTAHPERQLQPKEKELRYDDPESAAAEEGIIRILYLDQGLCRGKELPPPEMFSSPALARIYSVLKGKFENGDIISMASMSAALLPQEAALLASVLQKPEALRNGDKALADYIERIKNRHELKQSGGDLRQLANRLKETKGYEG